MQQNNNDCSVACLMTVLMHYNIKPNREKLLKKVGYKKDNYNAYDIVKMSEVYGLNCHGIKTSIDKINKFPVIAHTVIDKNYFHFIVIYKYDKKRNKITIMDPKEGLKEITLKDFKIISTGVFLTFAKTKDIKKENNLKKELLKIVSSNKKIIIKALMLSIFSISLSLLFNYYLNLILINYKKLSLIKVIVIVFVIVAALKNIIDFLKNKLILSLNNEIDKDITKRVTNHLLSLPYRYFESKTSGEIISIISDIESFKMCITKIFILSFIDLFLLLFVIAYIYILNIYVGLFITFIIISILYLTNRYKYIFNNSFTPYKVRYIDYNSNLIEVLKSIETIKNLNIEKKVNKGLSKKYISMKEKEKTYNKKYYNYEFINSFLIDNSYILLILLSVLIISYFGYNINNIVLYSSIYYMIINFLNNITSTISTYKVEEYKVNKVLDLLSYEKEKNIENYYLLINKISYKNISYKNILKNINLELNKNDKVFITGPSGVGKSTLFKLLIKHFTTNQGSILLDDININEYSPYFLRDKITYVSQNETLFKGSILSNLKIVEKDLEKIKKVSKLTLLDKTLSKNNIKYNYLIDEFASNISGGEKKKIILTRALLKMKEVLILDEVFNEIPVEEETIILKNIFNTYKDKIIIVISHRNNNINLFNKKYLLKGDDIVEIK